MALARGVLGLPPCSYYAHQRSAATSAAATARRAALGHASVSVARGGARATVVGVVIISRLGSHVDFRCFKSVDFTTTWYCTPPTTPQQHLFCSLNFLWTVSTNVTASSRPLGLFCSDMARKLRGRSCGLLRQKPHPAIATATSTAPAYLRSCSMKLQATSRHALDSHDRSYRQRHHDPRTGSGIPPRLGWGQGWDHCRREQRWDFQVFGNGYWSEPADSQANAARCTPAVASFFDWDGVSGWDHCLGDQIISSQMYPQWHPSSIKVHSGHRGTWCNIGCISAVASFFDKDGVSGWDHCRRSVPYTGSKSDSTRPRRAPRPRLFGGGQVEQWRPCPTSHRYRRSQSQAHEPKTPKQNPPPRPQAACKPTDIGFADLVTNLSQSTNYKLL
ncbi:hypothetical protein BDV95DRAFT_589549 [Massariosphaeria phaeospora]|uniref:Uncharacterized protein n=1 Tax=Massariosphaeria phaeospora TaxID=100035 RepID=A0A7C8IL19_9PLEO|nr:hypothetical protein BDV95DRAFT_589549 [Massariosphaeria phaeospora]